MRLIEIPRYSLRRNCMHQLHKKLVNLIYFEIYEFDIAQTIFSFFKI